MKLLFSPNNQVSLTISKIFSTKQFSGGNSSLTKREFIRDDTFVEWLAEESANWGFSPLQIFDTLC